jgi:hypothetical protein
MAGAYSVTLFVLFIPSFRHSVIPPSSVSVHFHSYGCIHSSQIWHMDMSWENTGQVRIWGWFDDFWQSYVPFTLKIIRNYQFPFITSPTVLHIQLKLDIWICHDKIQVKFEFGHGLVIFGRAISPTVLHIQLKLDIWICQRNAQVKFEFGHGSMIFGRVMPFHFENNMKF